ncbi:hypothetical protein Tco_1473836 [Tanacetum coccineum]
MDQQIPYSPEPPLISESTHSHRLSDKRSFKHYLSDTALAEQSANWECWTGLHEMAMAAFESQYIDIKVQSCFLEMEQLTNLSPPRYCMPPDVLLRESRQHGDPHLVLWRQQKPSGIRNEYRYSFYNPEATGVANDYSKSIPSF